ncbi:MAG TPA: hypothetical protein O0X39_07050 [Methanocorpusculum sp.]|nr:hypothetical protein [Methanocorpusculum sp.]
MKRWYEYPELADEKTLRGLFETGMTRTDIARKIGCSVGNINTAQKNHRISQAFVDLCRVKKGKGV